MDKQMLSWGLMVIGLIGALVSAFANWLGLGGYPGIGWKKSLGIIVGVLLIAVGGYLRRKLSSTP